MMMKAWLLMFQIQKIRITTQMMIQIKIQKMKKIVNLIKMMTIKDLCKNTNLNHYYLKP